MLYRLLGCLSLLLLIQSCQNSSATDYVTFATLRGKTMGTTYSIIFKDANQEAASFKEGVDSVLFALNMEVSTYIPASVISKVNKSELQTVNILELVDGDTSLCTHFVNNFEIAKTLYGETAGMLDPTVMPLVNYWGFGYSGRDMVESVDSTEVQRLLQLVDFNSVQLNGFELQKASKETKLDFSSVAKGYGVDLVGQYLEKKGINDYLIEIGGEMLGSGKNRESDTWKVGINTPVAGASQGDYEVIVALEEGAIATSGNYRIFYENEEGERFAHIINPKTGFSELSRLLSVSVFAETCAEADGLATGFMTMGLDASVEAVEEIDGVDACFIFVNEEGELEVKYSKGLRENILLDKTKS